MTNPKQFVTLYFCFEDLDTVAEILPTVLTECRATNSGLIVVDSSQANRVKMFQLIVSIMEHPDEFPIIQCSSFSMGFARNIALSAAIELYAPEYICMLEDDHGFTEGLVQIAIGAMKKYYGQTGPIGLRFGLFTACPFCWGQPYMQNLVRTDDGHLCVANLSLPLLQIGGANSCFRCAPTVHWVSVLKGYDTDEYPISTFQTAGLNYRNYQKGFTSLVLGSGDLVIRKHREGRGYTIEESKRPFDKAYSMRDPRSNYKKSS
ncbi:MAG: hypothetical protein RIF37_13845 [Rhodospirillaceae bacterium]|jgi:hypothetical protein